MEKMGISSHADLQALQHRSDGRMFLKLVSLESVRIASDSYALLRDLIERRYWRCPQMDLLSLVASVALELHKIKHDLFPRLVQEATLEGGFLKALLLLKNSAVTLVGLSKEIVKKRGGSLVEKDVLLGKVKDLGVVLEDTVGLVMNGTRNFAWLQGRVPVLLNLVGVLLSTPVHFPDHPE
jgi:hypothetical protein